MSGNTILLFGLPRSGTTWIGKIFDSHPDTIYRHEPDSWQRLDEFMPIIPTEETEGLEKEVQAYVAKIPYMRAPKVCSKLPIFPKNYYGRAGYFYHKSGIFLNKLVTRVAPNTPVYGCPTTGNQNTYLVWKSIESLGRLKLIRQTLPNSYSIHIMRHPCGYVASILNGEKRSKFSERTASGDDTHYFKLLSETDQAKRRDLDPEKFNLLSSEERLAWKWVIMNEKAIEEMAESEDHQTLIYDNFCNSPSERIKDFFEGVNLPQSNQTENFIRKSTSFESDKYYSINRDPKKAANKWRSTLTDSQKSKILAILDQSSLSRYFPST